MDALTVLTQQLEKIQDHLIVLNSAALLKQVPPYLYNYGYEVVFTWFDNDPAGKGATQAVADYLQTQRIRHQPVNNTYAAFKDLNDHSNVTFFAK